MSTLEQRYRRLLAAYPPAYRERREEELVGALLDSARPGQRRPDTRQAASLVANGLGERVRSAEEWSAGLALAGAMATAMVSTLALAAIGVAVLPPSGATYPYGPSAATAVASWSAALVVTVFAVRRVGPRQGLAAQVLATFVVVAASAFGADLMGLRRTYVLPFAALAVLAAWSPRRRLRTDLAAVAVGAATAGLLLRRFGDQYGPGAWSGSTDPLWTRLDRWVLAARLATVPSDAWLPLAALAVLAGLVRPRFAIAAAAVALPIACLSRTSPRAPDLSEALVAAVAIGLVVLLVLGLRRWARVGYRTAVSDPR